MQQARNRQYVAVIEEIALASDEFIDISRWKLCEIADERTVKSTSQALCLEDGARKTRTKTRRA